MYYILRDDTMHKADAFDRLSEDGAVGVFGYDKAEELTAELCLPPDLLSEARISRYTRYETREGFDFLCINWLLTEQLHAPQRRILLYLDKQMAVFFTEDASFLQGILEEELHAAGEKVSVQRTVYQFFNRMTKQDGDIFTVLESEIMNMEKALIMAKKRDFVREIISLRKRLLLLRKYYEQILTLLDGIDENENEIFDRKTLQYFRLLEKRVERLFQNVLNQQDAVTQLREAYQAEVDISLNTTMKVFTVLTSIFQPLTLIVGWYGMNLMMPEYDWKHGYMMVILLSVVVVGLVIYLFKKKGWFE